MSWANGSSLFSEIIKTLMDNIDDEDTRSSIYNDLIPAFENADCDNLFECTGIDPAFDLIWEDMHPDEDYFEDEDDDYFEEEDDYEDDD